MRFANDKKAAIAKSLPCIIYVEGKDDAYFIDQILEELSADPSEIGIIYLEGNGELEKEVRLLVKSAPYVQNIIRKIAFILDADDDPLATLDRLQVALARNSLPAINHNEIIDYEGNRRAGAFIIPDGTSSGELEDLLLSTLQNDMRLGIVSSALAEVEANYGPLNKHSKRLARMYMSVLPIKPCGIGMAYRANIFDKHHAKIMAVKSFIQSL